MIFSSLHIPAPDQARALAVRKRIDQLTKPLGALGDIEALAEHLSSIAPLPEHGYTRRGILIAAADHGVAEEGVSAYPTAVTGQMIGAFLGGFAAISAFARSANARVLVVDFGTATVTPPHPSLLSHRIAAGTANLAHGPAMSAVQLDAALDAGVAAARTCISRLDCEILALGEMGIANTTSAAALTASLTGEPAERVVGRGTGIDDAHLARKRAVVEAAVARVEGLPIAERIAALGGFEIVGLAGVIAACAERRIPVILDGFITAAAALVARALAPGSTSGLIAAHRSCEPGHAVALESLALRPLFDLQLRLGEATGASLAFGLCDAAARMHGEMMTFTEAGVATKIDAAPLPA